MRVGSLFTGYGGLDMAVEQHYDADTVWVADIDPGACKILAHRYPHAPNLGDITAVDWAAVEPVDILTGGWPCQPFSHAGKRLGAADARALWPEVARAVRALRPRYVVLENVAAVLTAGELDRALGDLASSGYVGSWRCLRAADIGAPHGRNRCFILATNTERSGRDGRPRQLGPGWWVEPQDRSDTPADPDQAGPQGPESAQGRHLPDRSALADPSSDGRNGHAFANPDRFGQQGVRRFEPGRRDPDRRSSQDVAWGQYEPAIRRWEARLDRAAPAPTEVRVRLRNNKKPVGMRGSLRGYDPRLGGYPSHRLSAHFVEWLMGLPAGWVTDVPGLTRNQQLKALGNGVVPQQALAALDAMARLDVAA